MSVVMQRGFSMIEVLVSIFVLAIGVLGAAGMQLAAMRTSQQSVFQAVALQSVTELADKMRANDQMMKKASGNNPFLNIKYSTTDKLTAPSSSCYSQKDYCDATEIAAFDIYEWQQRLKAMLPSAYVVVCNDATPWDDSANGYTWDCDAAATDGAVVIKIGWQSKNPDGSLIRTANQTDADQPQFPPNLALVVAPYIQ